MKREGESVMVLEAPPLKLVATTSTSPLRLACCVVHDVGASVPSAS